MKQDRCCPAADAIKTVWENELQNERTFLENTNFQELSTIFKVLSHPLRLKIVLLLLRGDHCVCELVDVLQEKHNLISHNLSILKDHKLIEPYNRSKYRYYRLNKDAIRIIRCINENLISEDLQIN